MLNGHLDPEGDPSVTECKFEWGTTASYGNSIPCAGGDSFGAANDVSAVLGGLSARTTYHFRLHIQTTSNGAFDGADQSFTTDTAPVEFSRIASFGKDGTASSSFSRGASPEIEHATRKLYVGVAGHASGKGGELYGFDASAPPSFTQLGDFPTFIHEGSDGNGLPIAVDNTKLGSAGNVYFTTHYFPGAFQAYTINLYGVDSKGQMLPGFPIDPRVNPGPPYYDSPEGGPPLLDVAVNSKGEVWVSTGKWILKYSATGNFLGGVELPSTHNFLALDTNDDLYLATSSSNSIQKLTAHSGYTAVTTLPSPSVTGNVAGLAVDPSTHLLYVNMFVSVFGGKPQPAVVVYTPDGEPFNEFGSETGRAGIVVDPLNHYVYVGDETKVDVFAPGATLSPPTASTGEAKDISASKATLTGLVDPEGQPVTECEFEWGSGSAFDKSVPCDIDPGSGSGDVAVSAEITGLLPGQEYYFRIFTSNDSGEAKSIRPANFFTPQPPTVGSPNVTNVTHDSAELGAVVNPKGFDASYYFEYGTTTAYGAKVPFPDGDAGSGTDDIAVSASISGLSADTVYHWRIVVQSSQGTASLPDQTFLTFGGARAETTGSPIRTATTALLQGRILPNGASTTYYFEYGAEGSCSTSACTALPKRSAGAGDPRFVAEQIEGLEPNTTYHYRVIAESTLSGGPVVGGDMAVTTRASGAALSHGEFPGPPESDRAWEQVSLPDTGGNPVPVAYAVSDEGDRAFYRVSGGTPISSTGSAFNLLFAERSETEPHVGSWRSQNIGPSREESIGGTWTDPIGQSDLSNQISENCDGVTFECELWRLRPGQKATLVYDPKELGPHKLVVSSDASRVLMYSHKSLDEARPTSKAYNIYDVSTGDPRLVSLRSEDLPCEASSAILSADGSVFLFACGSQLYKRDLNDNKSELVTASGILLKWISGYAFFTTDEGLEPGDAGGTDLYQYDLQQASSKCITCFSLGISSEVTGSVAIAQDGSRAYFTSDRRLLPGVAAPGVYRVRVSDGDLAYVAPIESATQIGEKASTNQAITPDGQVLIFASESPDLNAIGGQQNGGTLQYYRYDDHDRSLVCLSCPQNGDAPLTSVPSSLFTNVGDIGIGSNKTTLSADGRIFAFATATSLTGPDQNTARPGQSLQVGTDIYEWRDGQLLLVTDGLIEWPANSPPEATAISPSGNDIFFVAAHQFTPDALDGYQRLYTARVGGGFKFPIPPRPCPLEVCQGTPKGAPGEQVPGTGSFTGPGNTSIPVRRSSCPKGQRKVRNGGRTRCVKKRARKPNAKLKRSQHNRRAR